MKFDPLKAFPYPVLREGTDDYMDGAFQAAIFPEVVGDGCNNGLKLQIEGMFTLSVTELADLIEKGVAKFAISVSCRNTFKQQLHEFTEAEFKIEYESGELEGEFMVSPYIVATKKISEFQCELINPEFGNGPFSFLKGSVLAQAPDEVHQIRREYFNPVTSIFEFQEDTKIPNNLFKVNLEADKIRIQVNKELKNVINKSKAQEKFQAVIFNAIYLPALVRVLAVLDGDDEKYQGKLWHEVVKQRLAEKNIPVPVDDPVAVAQRLFDSPLRHLVKQFEELIKEVAE